MEVDYKIKFAQKYFDKAKSCDFDINRVDLILKNKKSKPVLYIESKIKLTDKQALRKARAQVILTNKIQTNILCQVGLIYKDQTDNDILELIKCDDSVMFNNDINWSKETPSNPTKDAIDRINDRLTDKITSYKNDEIKELYKALINDENEIHISLENVILIFNEYKNSVQFENEIANEQDLINLFLVDMLNGTKYKKDFITDEKNLFGKEGEHIKELDEDLIREGTNLNNYAYTYDKDGSVKAIIYTDKNRAKFELYPIKNIKNYHSFWAKYKRPPHKNEFLQILEHSARLYSQNYRKSTGGEYTPSCFVELQNEILKKHYDLNEFLVFDPCAGVGNLENQFGKDFKDFCYLSTLEQMDVDICKIKGFLNAVKFDYLKDDSEPLFKHNGKERTISEICKLENKKLMVIMNPPYQIVKGFKYDLAIEFFIKISKLKPQVIVYYCKTEFFFRQSIEPFLNSGYKIVSHIFSNAKKTFMLSEWSVSQAIFDKDRGEKIDKNKIKADRYELDLKSEKLKFIKNYTYDFSKPCLLDELDRVIKDNQKGMILGQYSKLMGVLTISNGGKEKPAKITTQNLKYCLLSKGLNFNSHCGYFEWGYLIYRGKLEQISQELFGDAICFSLFYKGNLFSNKAENITMGGVLPLKTTLCPLLTQSLVVLRASLMCLSQARLVLPANYLIESKQNPLILENF